MDVPVNNSKVCNCSISNNDKTQSWICDSLKYNTQKQRWRNEEDTPRARTELYIN